MEVPTLYCRNCGETKAHSDFHNDRSTKRGKQYYCKECVKLLKNVNPNTKNSTKNSHLKRCFGITLLEYNQMFDRQKGCCAICWIPQSELKRALEVDHDHKTGKIRGLLCGDCNRLLGFAKESRGILIKAIQYLR